MKTAAMSDEDILIMLDELEHEAKQIDVHISQLERNKEQLTAEIASLTRHVGRARPAPKVKQLLPVAWRRHPGRNPVCSR